ncbi:MAG: alpha-amylase family glycosyl hydrolase [Actinomycetota bacterium]
MVQEGDRWWRDGVLYQIYPRSFADSNGDGVGDLRGIIGKLDHLAWLGVSGIWLSPVMRSPNKDWGYDVADYKSIDPELGTLEDAEELIEEAGRHGIRILFDLVPNHTSDQHDWFRDAVSGREARFRDWYVWADPKDDGSAPNNWISVFGGESAWELDVTSGQYYLHNFLQHQPDLNWWNGEVRDEFDDILRFWFDRGVAGFRIDVAHAIVKDSELRDNTPTTDQDLEFYRNIGQLPEYNMNRPETHDVLRRWRKLADTYDPQRILVGETYVHDLDRLVEFYGQDDELNLAFNFPFIHANFESKALRATAEKTMGMIPPASWPVWTGSNHDVGRFARRWCEGDDAKIRCVLMVLLMMRGTPFLYYGDEIGMDEPEIAYEDLKDPVGLRFWPVGKGRDSCRTPMQWTAEQGAGFTEASVETWLPLGDYRRTNVTAQKEDPTSVLRLTRDLIALRREAQELTRGSYDPVDAPDGLWAWARGGRWRILVNLSDNDAVVDAPPGRVVLHTTREWDDRPTNGSLELGAWQGIVIDGA